MARPTAVEVKVSRKLSQSYNSTEYSFSVQLEITERESASANKVEQLVSEWSEKLRGCIRQEFARTNGKNANGLSNDVVTSSNSAITPVAPAGTRNRE